MENNNENKIPSTPEKQASNVRSYFTKEINEQIAGMSTKQMERLMKEFITTPYWIALLKYDSMRMPLLDSMLRSTNPVKEPHQISWAQGCMAGLCDVETYVIDLNNPDKPGTEEQAAEKKSTIIGG